MTTTAWLASIWNSSDRLSWWSTAANVLLALLILVTFALTAFTIITGVRKDALQRIADQAKDQLIADAKNAAAQALATSEESKAEQKRLDLQIEQERSKNLQLQAQVEHERGERLRLQQRVLPRRLTLEDKSNFRAALEREALKGLVSMGFYVGTDDGTNFTNDLLGVIQIAKGWSAQHTGQYGMAGGLVGVAIVTRNRQDIPPHASALERALAVIGLKVSWATSGETQIPVDAGGVFLWVGPKQ